MSQKTISLVMFLMFALTACGPGEDGTADSSGSNAAIEEKGDDNTNTLALTTDVAEIDPLASDSQELLKEIELDLLEEIEVGKDHHSFAMPDQVQVEHITLDLTVDFEKKVLTGSAELRFIKNDLAATILRLDTRDLTIHSVSDKQGQEVPFELQEVDPLLGSPLKITLPKTGNTVVVSYTTSPQASGLQWLTPAQTAGGKQPFLFSQAQAIHARSFIPLQDSPQVRVTYDATIRTPKNLIAVMSADNAPDAERDGVYEFNMPQPIPSYLIALAVGDLQFKAMSERTGVYAESGILDAAAKEFADTEAMLVATEATFGAYDWDRYDLLILPPSFPFGGMENPRLSFITPTVIAGDKSLVALIAHELAHSWSGNSVSNATWRDLWLNEGFTTYLTYRIMEIVYGEDRFNMEAALGYQDLEEAIASLEADDQILAIDLRGRDPDDVFSNIPYEKGALFLREIETMIGRDNFDKFLKQYFQGFAFQSITTDQFVDYLKATLLSEYPANLNIKRIEKWIFDAGLPSNVKLPESDAFTRIDATRAAWLGGEQAASEIDTTSWTVHEWLYFLNNLPAELSEDQMVELDSAFALTTSKNNEIAHSWLLTSINNWYEPALPRLHEYLTTIGRNKLVKPLYKALANTEKGKALGQKAFAEAKDGYHPLTIKTNQKFVE